MSSHIPADVRHRVGTQPEIVAGIVLAHSTWSSVR